MCRNVNTQIRLIEEAKRGGTRVHALYVHTDWGDDLVALVEQDAEFATLIKEVDENDEPVTTAIRRPTFNVTKKSVLSVLGLVDDYEKQRGFYRLALC